MDFDAHDGDKARARDLAFKAFAALFQHPELFLVLCLIGKPCNAQELMREGRGQKPHEKIANALQAKVVQLTII